MLPADRSFRPGTGKECIDCLFGLTRKERLELPTPRARAAARRGRRISRDFMWSTQENLLRHCRVVAGSIGRECETCICAAKRLV